MATDQARQEKPNGDASADAFRHESAADQQQRRDAGIALPCVHDWNDLTRLHVGGFLADSIFATELLTTVMVRRGVRNHRLVVPTEQAEEFIKSTKPRQYNPSHLAMLVPPRIG